MSEVTREGEKLIDDWKAATSEVARSNKALGSAECHLANTINALKNWLVPSDYREGEKFCVAYGKEFIQIEILPLGSAILKIRPRK